MKRLTLSVCLSCLALCVSAATTLNIKLSFFEEVTADKQASAQVVTSFYLKSIFSGVITSSIDVATQKAELQKIFHMQDIRLLSQGDLVWNESSGGPVSQTFQIGARTYLATLLPKPQKQSVQFQISLAQESEKKEQRVLLETELSLPDGQVAALGFRNELETSYFLSFYIQSRSETAGSAQPKNEALRVPPTKRPRLVKRVDPIFPKEALDAHIQGIVMIEARTDETGNVVEAMPLGENNAILQKAAIDAIRQWKYEPYKLKGVATPVQFTVTVTFTLGKESKQPMKKNETVKKK